MKTIQNKRIGKVIFFVEGDKDEPVLLKKIFHDTFGYPMVLFDKRDNSKTSLEGRFDDPYSKVFVIPMTFPSIHHLPAKEDFLERMYQSLKENGLQYDEARIYYLFDRDPGSNAAKTVEEKIDALRDPLDNGVEFQGALILSYPCIQSFYLGAHKDNSRFGEGQTLKRYLNLKPGYSQIGLDNVLFASGRMLDVLKKLLGKPFTMDLLDDYSKINKPLFEAEEARFAKNRKYETVSILSLALIDLGIIEID